MPYISEKTNWLVFTKVEKDDRVQFYNESLRLSIFVSDKGIEACGPDSQCVVMLKKENLQQLSN